MKNRIVLIITTVFLIANSSCFLLVFKEQSLNERLLKNAKHISNTDFSKIEFKGIYLNVSNENQNPQKRLYNYFRFFPDGRVFQHGIYDRMPTKNDFDDLTKGVWSVYYVVGNHIYIEEFNVTMGYTLYVAYFSENNKKIIFTDNRTMNGRIIILRPRAYTLQLIN